MPDSSHVLTADELRSTIERLRRCCAQARDAEERHQSERLLAEAEAALSDMEIPEEGR